MSSRPLLAFLVLPALTVAACSSAQDDNQSDPGAAMTATGSKGFVQPHLTNEQVTQVLAKYSKVDSRHVVADNLRKDALVFYDTNLAKIPNSDVMGIVDFSLSNGKKRFFVVDMKTGAVTPHMVAHGAGSDPRKTGMATQFGNVDSTHMSSLGFVLTGEIYNGKHGRSLRLDGLSDTDSNIRARDIVIHGAAYVHESAKKQGNSWGCFAVDMDIRDKIIDAFKGGALLYAGKGTGHASDDEETDPSADESADPTTTVGDAGPKSAQPGSCTYDADCGEENSGFGCLDGVCVATCSNNEDCPDGQSCDQGVCQ